MRSSLFSCVSVTWGSSLSLSLLFEVIWIEPRAPVCWANALPLSYFSSRFGNKKFFLVGLGFELRVSCLQRRPSTTWVTLPVHPFLIVLWDRISLSCPGWPGTYDSHAFASRVLELQVWSTCLVEIPLKVIYLFVYFDYLSWFSFLFVLGIKGRALEMLGKKSTSELPLIPALGHLL
jgi:hypothetical protein